MRRLLLDWKTVHVGTRYASARARDRPSGAVEERAQRVHTEYLAHARRLDRRYHPQASPPVTLTPGPVEQVVLDQSQYAGLTRLQLDQVGRERQAQRLGAERAETLAEGSVELAQAMIPRAHALARGGG